MKEDICEELIRLQPYIINKAKHYIVNEADLDDFVQEGMITLYRKIPQYNPLKNSSYIQYVDYQLHLTYSSLLNKERYIVTIPKKIQFLAYKIEELQRKADETLGQRLSTMELSKMLNEPIQLIEYIENMNANWKNTDSLSIEEIKEAELNSHTPLNPRIIRENKLEEAVIVKMEAQEVLTLLKKFSLEEQEVFLRKLGFGSSGYPETYEEIAKSYHETFQNTQKRFKKVLNRLQNYYKRTAKE